MNTNTNSHNNQQNHIQDSSFKINDCHFSYCNHKGYKILFLAGKAVQKAEKKE